MNIERSVKTVTSDFSGFRDGRAMKAEMREYKKRRRNTFVFLVIGVLCFVIGFQRLWAMGLFCLGISGAFFWLWRKQRKRLVKAGLIMDVDEDDNEDYEMDYEEIKAKKTVRWKHQAKREKRAEMKAAYKARMEEIESEFEWNDEELEADSADDDEDDEDFFD